MCGLILSPAARPAKEPDAMERVHLSPPRLRFDPLAAVALRALPCLGAALLLLVLQETASRSSLAKALHWLYYYPTSAAFNFVLICSILAFFAALSGKAAVSLVLTGALLGLLTLVNVLKLAYLQTPFYPWDLLYWKHLRVLLPALPAKAVLPATGCFLLFILACCVFVFRKERTQLRSFLRIVLLLFFITVWVPLWQGTHETHLGLFRLQNATWNKLVNYDTNGFLGAFCLNLSPLLLNRPDDYTEESVRTVLETTAWEEAMRRAAKVSVDSRNPINLVLFVSESFWDLEDIPFTSPVNPLANFERLREKHASFHLVSPTFGGNTSLVEFELLTGLSNAFLPRGAVPYDHYVKRELPSIAQILRGKGYRTLAIHPYYGWFWSRDRAYPLMGFQEFVSLSNFEGAETRGGFVSDRALVDKVIETLEDTDKPFFLFVLSMQNHGSYWPQRYAPDEVEIQADYPEPLRQVLQTYVTGLRDADRELGRLLDYLATRPDPVLFFFCGDHRPSFGPDLAIYRDRGAAPLGGEKDCLEENFRMARVPCLFWTNGTESLNLSGVPDSFSPAYVPAILLDQMGIELPNHFRYLLSGLREYPVLHRDFVIAEGSETIDPFEDHKTNPFLQALNLLQYDVLFGSRFCLKFLPEPPAEVLSSALPAQL